MSDHGRRDGPVVWFLGDLDDPWVAGLADSLPRPWPNRRANYPGDLPEAPFGPGGAPDVLILHRSVLTAHDASRVARWRSDAARAPRVILCYGPHARAVDLDGWAPLVDAAVPEATARESLPRLLGRSVSPGRAGVAVVAANLAIRSMIAEAVEAAGFLPTESADWNGAPPSGLAVWEVPVLEPGWPDALAARASAGPVVALIGFADRALVELARSRGAAACLELPFDLDDLSATLGRLSAPDRRRAETGHATPPPPNSGAGRTARVVPGLSDRDLGA